MLLEIIAILSQAISTAKYVYSTKDETVTKLEYEKLYVMDQHMDPFITGC